MIPFHVGYKKYDIHLIDNPMGDNHGICKVDEGTIYVDRNLRPEDQLNTLIHECLHAIYNAYGIVKDDEEEESVVRVLANGITDVVLRNPKLMKTLQKLAEDVR